MNISNLVKLFNSDSIEDYIKIIEVCDNVIAESKENAVAYYFRGMAKMGVATSLEFNNILLLHTLFLDLNN